MGASGSAQRAHGIVKPDRAPARKATPAPSSGSAEEGTGGVPESEGGSGTPSTPAEPQKGSQGPQRAAKSSTPTVTVVGGGGSGVVSSGAGFLLGLVFWGWVALPFLKGGPQGVKNMLKAKFLNKAPDGSWLP